MNLAEQTFYLSLTEVDSLRFLVTEGVDDEILPTADLLPVWHFAYDYFIGSGMAKAPTPAVLDTEYGDLLNDFDLDAGEDPDESIEWALEHLRASWVYSHSADFVKSLANEMGEADPLDRVAILSEKATELLKLTHTVQSRSERIDFRVDGHRTLAEYEHRAAHLGEYSGASSGMSAVDAATNGIHPGELAIAAAGPKTGKSFWLAYIALKNWQDGVSPTLFTLENSVEMTMDRIACLATFVDPIRWQRGTCAEAEVDRVREWINETLPSSDVPFHILKPDLGQRSFETMVAEAQVRDAGVLLVDQLTFVELGGDSRRPKHERIGDALHRLKGMISTGRRQLPCWLAHQINREGVKAAEKLGYLELYHLAESAEVERTADWVYGLYASKDDRGARRAKLQTLATRRGVTKNWELDWYIETGVIDTRREIDLAS